MQYMKSIRNILITANIIILAVILILLLLFVAANNKSKTEVANKASIAAQKLQQHKENQTANNLQIKLNQIEQQIVSLNQNKTIQKQINGLSQNMAGVITSVTTAQKAAQQNTQALQKNYQALTAQINSLNAEVNKLNTQLTPIKYLPANVLPFKVAGIDFWNNRPMVSIAVKDTSGVIHYRLIGEGMETEGWRVKSLNAETKTVIFINSKNKKVKTEL